MQRESKTWHDRMGKVIHWELCKKKLIWPYEQMVYTQPRFRSRKWDVQNSLFRDKNKSYNLGQTTRPSDNKQEKENLPNSGLYRCGCVKMNESEKKDKYLDLAREPKTLRNIKVTVILIVIGARGTITKGLVKWLVDFVIGGRVETIQTTSLLKY